MHFFPPKRNTMRDTAAQAEALGQALKHVALNASLSNLPTFSDDVREDKMTAIL